MRIIMYNIYSNTMNVRNTLGYEKREKAASERERVKGPTKNPDSIQYTYHQISENLFSTSIYYYIIETIHIQIHACT